MICKRLNPFGTSEGGNSAEAVSASRPKVLYQICTVCGANLREAMVCSVSTFFVDSCKHCSVIVVFQWEMAALQQLLLSKGSGTVKAYKDASWPWLDESCFRSCISSRSNDRLQGQTLQGTWRHAQHSKNKVDMQPIPIKVADLQQKAALAQAHMPSDKESCCLLGSCMIAVLAYQMAYSSLSTRRID